MEGLVDDDLPPLLSDTEGSDGSDMPDLENSSSAGEEGQASQSSSLARMLGRQRAACVLFNHCAQSKAA
jgi:hypothetical protein